MLVRFLPHPVLTVTLLVVWLLLVNSTGPGALLMGLIWGLALPPLVSRFWTDSPRFRRPGVLLRLIPIVLWDIMLANLTVAWLTLTRASNELRPAFLEIPLAIRDPAAVVSLASIITLTPGTVSVQLSEDRHTLYVHALDCPDVADAVREIKSRYEAPLKELLEP